MSQQVFLSDDLSALLRSFNDYRHGGMSLDSDAVEALCTHLEQMGREARLLENAVSRHLWNQAAARDEAKQTERVLAALAKPNSNVALFPVIPRPVYGGGDAA